MIGANKALSNQRSAVSPEATWKRARNLNREHQVPTVDSCLVDVSAAIYRERKKHGQQG
jgi:hypothetical protein